MRSVFLVFSFPMQTICLSCLKHTIIDPQSSNSDPFGTDLIGASWLCPSSTYLGGLERKRCIDAVKEVNPGSKDRRRRLALSCLLDRVLHCAVQVWITNDGSSRVGVGVAPF